MKHLLPFSLAVASLLSLNAVAAIPLLRSEGLDRTVSAKGEIRQANAGVRNNMRKAPSTRPTRASDLELSWGYCDEPYGCFPISGDIKVAFMMPGASLESLAGNTISGVEFVNPVNVEDADEQLGIYPCAAKEATVWLSTSLDSEPIVSKTAKLDGGGFDWSRIDFDTPYQIKEAENIYVGVSMTVPSGCFGVVTDFSYPMDDNSAFLYSTLKGITEEGEFDMSGNPGWKKVGDDIGNICIRAVLQGDNLPQNVVDFTDTLFPSAVMTDKSFPVQIAITNKGANKVGSIELTLEIEGQQPQTVQSDIMIGYNENYQPVMGELAYNGYGIISADFSCSLSANNIPYKLYISKINGKEENNGEALLSGYLLSLNSGFPKNNVVEEATGLWCQACVIGYAGMEYIKEKIPGLIGVAMHYNDLMDVFGEGKCYNPFLSKVDAFPNGFFNRNWGKVVYPSPEDLQDEYDMIADIPAMAKISATVTNASDDGRKIKLATSTEFSIAEKDVAYGVAYLVVEDELGPYPQTNGFSGYQGDAYGFQNLPNPCMLVFNDVIRNCSHPLAVESSQVKSTETGRSYDFETEINLTDVMNVDKYRIVALVLNGLTGVIENACVVESPTYSGVEEIKSSSKPEAIAFGGKGVITLRATGLDASVFTIDGACVATGMRSGEISLAPGLYIVSNGRESSKVVVK